MGADLEGSRGAQSVTLGLANWFAICIARAYYAPSAAVSHMRARVRGHRVETHRLRVCVSLSEELVITLGVG